MKATLAGGFLVTVLFVLVVAMETIKTFVADMSRLTVVAFAGAIELAGQLTRMCMGLVAFVVIIGGVWWLLRQQYEKNRQRDGSFPLREYKEPLLRRIGRMLRGEVSPVLLINADNFIGGALMIADGGVHEMQPAGGWDRQLTKALAVEATRKVQALTPGDNTIGNPIVNMSGYRAGVANASTGKYLAGGWDKQPKQITVKPEVREEQPALPAPAPVRLDDAMYAAPPDTFAVGYTDDNKVTVFNPRTQAHAAIVGSPGTGKTTSVGYLMAAQALRQLWHVVILDADNGVSWSPFASYAEHMMTDHTMIGDQLSALVSEMDRRQAVMSSTGATDFDGLRNTRRMLVVIEEFGDLINTLRVRDKSGSELVENQLDTLLLRGRKAGMHFALIDQYPEHWSQKLIVSTKARYVFQLGPSQGAKMQEYKANELPDVGVFLHKGIRYNAWHAQPRLSKLLDEVPAMSVNARLIDRSRPVHSSSQGVHGSSQQFTAGSHTVEGEFTEVHGSSQGSSQASSQQFMGVRTRVDPTPTAMNYVPDTLEGWYTWTVDNYLTTHPELRQLVNERGVGIKALAERMAAMNGKTVKDMMGTASEVGKRIRAEAPVDTATVKKLDLSTAAGRATFASLAASARLPGGDKLGVDCTNGMSL